MRWRPTAHFFGLALALPGLVASTSPVDARAGQPGAVFRVRVWTYVTGALDVADRDQSTQVADALLETAGVTVDWQPCDGAPCLHEGSRGRLPGVTVILMSATHPTCGLTAFEPDGKSATVLVSVPVRGFAGMTLNLQRRAGDALAPAHGNARGAASPRRRPGARNRPRPGPEARGHRPHARAPRNRRRPRPPGRATRVQPPVRRTTDAGLAHMRQRLSTANPRTQPSM